MKPGYHRKLREVVYMDYLARPPVVPDIKLAIGWAENRAGVPLRVPRDYGPAYRQSIHGQDLRTQDHIQFSGRGASFDPELFPMTGYMGEGLAYG